MNNWGDWIITDEQAKAIHDGNREARDKFYFDNLDKLKRMCSTHCYKYKSCKSYQEDMLNNLYVDLSIFESAVNQPVTNVYRLKRFIYQSFWACEHGGLAYLYENNRKLLSGNKGYFTPLNMLSLESTLDYSNNLHNNAGGAVESVADTLEAPINEVEEEDYDIIKRVVRPFLSESNAEYLGYYIEGYAPLRITEITNKSKRQSQVKKELSSHFLDIAKALTKYGIYIKLPITTERVYKMTEEQRAKQALWARNWRAKQKAKQQTAS